MSKRSMSQPGGWTRRGFQHLALVVVPLVYGAGLLFAAARYLVVPLAGRRREARRTVGPREAFLEGAVASEVFNDSVVYVLGSREGDELVVKKATCPHLGCNVNWNADRGEFVCPCHGMTFRRDGTFIQGPTNKDLDDQAFEISPDGNVILLDDEEA